MIDLLAPETHAAQLLRRRILLTLGLTGAGLSGCGAIFKCDEPTWVSTVSLDSLSGDTGGDTATDTGSSATDEVCPTDLDQVREFLRANNEGCDIDEVLKVEQSGQDCTYSYTCRACCGYGRPYLDGSGSPVAAETLPSDRWLEPAIQADLRNLSPEERQAIGAYWRKNARAEHSSVAGFHRFALDLLAHGAPPELLARAQRAAAQELRHSIDSFTLASAFLGEPVGPAPMNLGTSAPIARNLAELAAWTARDGAIGETLAAFLAGRALERTTEPAVRRVLSTVVADETEHAELAWATLRWAIETGGDEVRRAVQAVFAGLAPPPLSTEGWTPSLGAHGVPSPTEEVAAANTCIARVIRPVSRALLSHPSP